MPKVELHLHLEGAIPPATMWELVQRHGGAAEVPDAQALAERFTFTDFTNFIATWVWKNRFIRTYADFELIGEAVAASLAEQNIVYAEAFFSPPDFHAAGLATGPIALALRRGLDRVDGTRVALVTDLVRDFGPERAARTLAEALEVAADAGIIGVGLGGSEREFPAAPFSAVYRRAAAAGLRLTAHAGEADGAPSVWSALRDLGAERIGHGVRSVEDPALVDRLVDLQVPLEVCPTSNLRTRVVGSWAEHPVVALIDAGALVTLNTDDPAMFQCSLAGEYEALAGHLDVGRDALRRLSLNAVTASWAPEDEKRRLGASVEAWWQKRSPGEQP